MADPDFSKWKTAKPKFEDWQTPADAQPTAGPAQSQPNFGEWQREAGGVVEGIQHGLKTGLAPFELTKEDYTKPLTLGGTAAATLTDLAAGIGVPWAAGALATAAIGAATGTAVAPGVGTAIGALTALGYGLYTGIGQEVTRSEAEGKDLSAGRLAARVALEANPMLGKTKKLVTAVRVLGQVAGSAGLEYAHSEDEKAAAAAGLFAIPAAGIMAWRGFRTPPAAQKQAMSVAEAMQLPAGRDLVTQAEKKFSAMGVDGTVRPKKLPMRFMRSIVGDYDSPPKQIVGKFKDVSSRMDPELLDTRWEIYQRGKALAEAGEEMSSEYAKTTGHAYQDIGVLRRFGADGKYVARMVDDTIGDDLEGILDTVSRANEASSVQIAAGKIRFTELANARSKLGISEDQIGRALNGAKSDIDQIYKIKGGRQLLQAYRKEWADLRIAMEKHGYSIREIKEYIPQQMKTGAELSLTIKDQIQKLRAATPKGTHWYELDEAAHPELANLKFLAKQLYNTEEPTPQQLTSLSEAALKRLKTKDGYSMRAMFGRTGSIPEAYQEFNIDKLAANYLNNTYKTAFIQPALEQLQYRSTAYRAMGLERTADWIDSYMGHMSGQPGIVGRQLNYVAESTRLLGLELMRSDSWFKQTLGKGAEGFPEFLAQLHGSVYPAYLGLNVRSMVRNLSQNYAVGAPELGGAYGYSAVNRAVKSAVQEVGIKPSKIRAYLKANSQLGDISEEIGPASSSLAEKASKFNRWMLGGYAYTDHSNRLVSHRLGHVWAGDIIKGTPAALNALQKASTGLKVRLRNVDMTDPKALGNVLGDYLISKTQFHYGMSQQSEAGRQLGRAFTPFTKWPLMMAGDVEERIRKKDIAGLAYRFGPMLALIGTHAMLKPWLEKESKPAATAYNFTLGNLAEWSPMMSLAQLESLTGGPIVQAIMATPGKLGKVAAAGTPDEMFDAAIKELRSTLRQGLKTYVPPVSTAINVADRLYKAAGAERTPSRAFINAVTFGENE